MIMWCETTQEGRPSEILEYIWIFNGEKTNGDDNRINARNGWLNVTVRVALLYQTCL